MVSVGWSRSVCLPRGETEGGLPHCCSSARYSVSTSPSWMATAAISELVTSGSIVDASRMVYTGAAIMKSRMLWMNEMKVQLKTWNTALGTCCRIISLKRVNACFCLGVEDGLFAYHR